MPQNEVVVLAGDMNGHVESSNVGYDGCKHSYRQFYFSIVPVGTLGVNTSS